MTERRATITLNWRPAGEPARRFDDFAEVPRAAAKDALRVPVPELELEQDRREIGSRLENWSRWCTANGQRPASSPTGAFCDRLRREALGAEVNPSGERRRIDEDDALLIERAMPKLDTKHRMLLWWCYIKQAPPHLVCNRMGIPNRPATEFVNRFRAAQAAIEDSLIN